MRFLLLLLVSTWIHVCPSLAQDFYRPGRNQAVYVEGLGSGILLSVNYDMRFRRGVQDGLGMRVGVGGASLSGTDGTGQTASIGIVTVPLMVNYLVGKRRSAFEVGAGLTPGYASARVTSSGTYQSAEGFGVFAGFLNVGYRLQPLRNGVVFRINWSPAINEYGFQPSWFGISLGYGFK
jgi:hypothetical protein